MNSRYYTNPIFRMEGRDFSWTEILKDADMAPLTDKYPSIYTNHWDNNSHRFDELQTQYIDDHVAKIIECLDLKQTDNFADLTDNNHKLVTTLRKKIKFAESSFCLGMPLDTLPDCVSQSGSVPLYCDSVKFLKTDEYFWRFKINKVFISDQTLRAYSDSKSLLHRLFTFLPEGARVLLSYRPEHNFLPLFDSARRAMAKQQKPLNTLREDLKAAGFNSLALSINSYKNTIDKQTWLAMLRARYFSFLDNLTVEEIEDGIEYELLPKYPDDEISFQDSFVYVVACK